MPTQWAVLELKPFNFFGHNPAIDIAPASATEPEADDGDEDSAAFAFHPISWVIVVTGLSLLWGP